MESLKLCKDCFYIERKGLFKIVYSFSKCQNSNSAMREDDDLVTGKPGKVTYRFASVMRLPSLDYCGLNAKYFKPRKEK